MRVVSTVEVEKIRHDAGTSLILRWRMYWIGQGTDARNDSESAREREGESESESESELWASCYHI